MGSKEQTVVVYIEQQDKRNLEIGALTMRNLLKYTHIGIAGVKQETSNNITRLTFTLPSDAIPKAAASILTWIAKGELTVEGKPKPLMDDGIFENTVYLYAAANAFKLNHAMRGNTIRVAIEDFMAGTALTVGQFGMIHELLPFDGGLQKKAKHQTIWRVVKQEEGSKVFPDGVPNLAEIKAYCADNVCEDSTILPGLVECSRGKTELVPS